MICLLQRLFGYTGGNMLKKKSKEELIEIIYQERHKLKTKRKENTRNVMLFRLTVRQLNKVRNQLNSIIKTYEQVRPR